MNKDKQALSAERNYMSILKLVSGIDSEDNYLVTYPRHMVKADALEFVNNAIYEIHSEIEANGGVVEDSGAEILTKLISKLSAEQFEILDDDDVSTNPWATVKDSE